MKLGTTFVTAGVLALGLAALSTPMKAQGPMYDTVKVDLPYSVTINDKVLQPGDYVIQQLRDQAGNSRVLLIYGDNGMRLETSTMTVPILDQNTPGDTKVILHHFGNDYYFDKIWIQGKDYGYEFPLPASVKARENERLQPISVAATYETTTPQAAEQEQTVAQATQPAPTVQEQPAPPPAEQPAAPQTVPEQPAAPPAMPHTSAGWLMMLLGGGTLSGVGLSLRRFRR